MWGQDGSSSTFKDDTLTTITINDAADEGGSSSSSTSPTQVVVPPFFVGESNQGPCRPKHLAVLKAPQQHFGANLKITSWYVISDTRQHQRPFAIGVLTIFLVVCFLRFVCLFLSVLCFYHTKPPLPSI